MNARDRILGRLRSGASPAPRPLPDVAGWYQSRRRDEPVAQRVSRLRSALEAVHTEVYETTGAEWAGLLVRTAQSKGLRHLLIGTGTAHGAELEALHPEGLQLLRYEQAIEHWRDQLFDEVDASLTMAVGGIAETGSLIVWPSASEPRLMSLVPSVHFVLLDVNAIHADFHSAIATQGWKNSLPTNALLISGPSKTADIQQTLAYGAHGPRELVVLLIHPQGEVA